MAIVDVIIPAFNEEQSIAKVIAEIPRPFVRNVYVTSNGSTDNTVEVARKAGAIVLLEDRKGYGWACLKAMDAMKENPPEIVVFLDGDFSDFPAQIVEVVEPILSQGKKIVIGSRVLGNREKASLTAVQVFGNWLATRLMKLFYKLNYTDLGPFRAIDYQSLMNLNMADKTYGWTIEMQLKAGKQKLPYCEVPVDYRKRIGMSKVSGTIKGAVGAGIKIIFAIYKYRKG